MAWLELDEDERRFLTRTLDRAFQDLRAEIYRTEGASMKEDLKREEELLAAILEKLGVHKRHAA